MSVLKDLSERYVHRDGTPLSDDDANRLKMFLKPEKAIASDGPKKPLKYRQYAVQNIREVHADGKIYRVQ